MNSFKKYLVEFIGTYFLVFVVAATALLGGSGVIPAIAIGFTLMVMVYAGGHISGGHYNPAVSLAAAIRGALSWKHIAQYWIFQCLGAVAAVYSVLPFAKEAAEPVTLSCPGLVVGEFLFTFALCYVVLNVATSKATEGNSYYGLAIGSTVVVGAFAVGGLICLGAFNPAVALGLGVAKLGTWCNVLTTIGVNLIAAVVAALVFKFVNPSEE